MIPLNKTWKILWIFTAALLLTCAFIWLRGGFVTVLGLTGQPLSMLVYTGSYFGLTLFFLKKYRGALPLWAIAALVLLGAMSLEIYARGLRPGGFVRTLGSLPDVLMRILAVFAALLFRCVRSRIGKWTVAVCLSGFALWSSYFGYDLWLDRLNYGTCTGRVHESPKNPLIVRAADSLTVDLRHTGKRYVLLYFWSSRCGLCREGFPLLQELNDRYAEASAVGLYSVFCSCGEPFGSENEYLERYGYTFTCLRIDQRDPALEEMRTAAHPVTLILDADGDILFRGSLERGARALRRLTGRE